MSTLTRDGTVELVSRDQILRHERGQGNIHFSCSADHVQDWQPYPVGPYSCYMCDHTSSLVSTVAVDRCRRQKRPQSGNRLCTNTREAGRHGYGKKTTVTLLLLQRLLLKQPLPPTSSASRLLASRINLHTKENKIKAYLRNHPVVRPHPHEKQVRVKPGQGHKAHGDPPRHRQKHPPTDPSPRQRPERVALLSLGGEDEKERTDRDHEDV